MVATRLLFAAFALQQATANPVGERGTAHRRSTTKAIQSYARYNGSLPVGYELDVYSSAATLRQIFVLM